MDIVVSVKRIPDTSDIVDVVKIDASGKDIKRDALIFKTNDWDECALEEAIQLKERLGGTVTAVTVGTDECDSTLRRALAMGADRAIRINEDVTAADSNIMAMILTSLISTLSYDLVMFGMQSGDFGRACLGVMCAELLDIPHAAGVFSLQVQDREVEVGRELEAGILELYTLKLPALLTIQTGINKPRYLSYVNIKKAQTKELRIVTLGELGLSRDALTPTVKLEKLEYPTTDKRAKIISGSVEEIADKLVEISKGLGRL
jgi:electron transfer flavoprotein beta subunit